MKNTLRVALFAAVLAFAASCSTPTNIVYFQDVAQGGVDTVSTAQIIKIKIGRAHV